MMPAVLRGVAIAIAVIALVDPAVTVPRKQPPSVEVRLGSGAIADDRAAPADAVRESLRGVADLGLTRATDAVVLIEPTADDVLGVPDDVPFSIVTSDDVPGPRILQVDQPRPVVPRQLAVVEALVLAPEQRPIRVVLRQDGVELASEVYRPASAGEGFRVSLAHAPLDAGIHRAQIVAEWAEDRGGERAAGAVDVPIVASGRPLRVLVYEPRPSWAATFVRRALESDPLFDLSVLTRPSRGIDVQAGEPPRRITEETLRPFDTVLVGSPEELTGGEVDALDVFARRRGGAILLVPDGRPSGASTRQQDGLRVGEVLLESGVALEGDGATLMASEFALPRDSGPGTSALAMLRHDGRPRPAIVSWPRGLGRVVFSGALDAWRHRAERERGFAAFWTTTVANLAMSAPRPLQLSAEPALTAPGTRVTVRAIIRPTEFTSSAAGTLIPTIGAAVVDGRGLERTVRLWPLAETGVFEGSFEPADAGRHVVRARAGELQAETPVLVETGMSSLPASHEDTLAPLANASGGVVVRRGNLKALRDHVARLATRDEAVSVHPMRTPWWILPFGALLCAEWAMRRRSGRR